MTEEDEAFEDLAKRQGDWGMQGSRKHQIMRYAENVESKGTSMTDKEAMRLALDWFKCYADGSMSRNNAEALADEVVEALKKRLTQPDPIQSLQCFHCQVTIETLNDKVMHLLAQRTWVGLTDEDDIDWEEGGNLKDLVKAIEAKLKEKNT
jgi:hypothetical protein